MKLNLLPTTVSKQRQSKTAWVFFVLILVVAILASAGMTFYANSQLAEAKAAADELKQKAVNAYALSQQADEIIAKAAPIIRNASLADAIQAHSAVYPRLYDEAKQYIPPFFRITQMTATPSGAGTATLTLVGTLKTYQEYTNLVLALNRWKKVTSVGRNGFNLDNESVPALQVSDQTGRAHKASDGVVPDDGLERLAYFQTKAQATPAGYNGQGAFGAAPDQTRGAMPGDSLVTITLSIKENLQVPDIAATLRSGGGATPAAAGAATTSPFGPGGPPPGGGIPSAPAGGRGKGGNGDE